jgi:hypothetical protein
MPVGAVVFSSIAMTFAKLDFRSFNHLVLYWALFVPVGAFDMML